MNQVAERVSETEEAVQPKWLGSAVHFHKGNIDDIRSQIPDFERRSFAITQPSDKRSRLNERLDTVVRKPFRDDPDFIPIGVVSKEYVLVPHTKVLDTALTSLKDSGIDHESVKVDLTITEYGERMALSLFLPDEYSFDPGDGHTLRLRLECLNSVEGSTRFRALMGWFRFVCSNGLVIGVTQFDVRRRHIGDISLVDIKTVLTSGIQESEKEKKNFKLWHGQSLRCQSDTGLVG